MTRTEIEIARISVACYRRRMKLQPSWLPSGRVSWTIWRHGGNGLIGHWVGDTPRAAWEAGEAAGFEMHMNAQRTMTVEEARLDDIPAEELEAAVRA